MYGRSFVTNMSIPRSPLIIALSTYVCARAPTLLIKDNASDLPPLDPHTRYREVRQQARVRVPPEHADLAVPLRPDGDERAGAVDGELPRDEPARADGPRVGERAGPAVDGEGDQRVARVGETGLAAGGDEEESVVGLLRPEERELVKRVEGGRG